MAKIMWVNSLRATVYMALASPDEKPDYTSVYEALRRHPSNPELPQLESDVEDAVKDMEAVYARLKAAY